MEAPTATSTTTTETSAKFARSPWNKGQLVGAKPPLRPSHVWSIRTKLQIEGKTRYLVLLNWAIDSKLRGCDVVAIRVDDVAPSGYAMDSATIRLFAVATEHLKPLHEVVRTLLSAHSRPTLPL